jgi:hypothetical protein
MKFLEAKPSCPPFLHLGSRVVALPKSAARTGKGVRQIEDTWRALSLQVVADPQRLREILKRTEARHADPSDAHDACEVFCTVTDDGYGQSLIDFYL